MSQEKTPQSWREVIALLDGEDLRAFQRLAQTHGLTDEQLAKELVTENYLKLIGHESAAVEAGRYVIGRSVWWQTTTQHVRMEWGT